jgi:hypothetical protein
MMSTSASLPSVVKPRFIEPVGVTRVNSTNVLDEGLRIRGVGHQMNSKVGSVKQGVYRK